MDRRGWICRTIWEQPQITQRELAQALHVSLGTANRLVKECDQEGLITTAWESGVSSSYALTERGRQFLEQYRVDGAVILAAGFGSRFVPLTFETPKGLLEVYGERMIERQIRQLHEAGIRDITIVVGYLKEKFEYLIDKYEVRLLYNPEYSSKNNLASVYHARKVMEGRNMYLLASDHWMRENLFHTYECASWYSSVYMEGDTSEWCFDLNKKGRVQNVTSGGRDAWVMYGPAYLSAEFLKAFLPVLEAYYHMPGTEQLYWEHVYQEMLNGTAKPRLESAGYASDFRTPELYANFQPAGSVREFENLEELRRFDPRYRDRSDNEALALISKVFGTAESEIRDIRCVKAGMTNQSFLFRVRGKAYICRIPGPGTGLLIDRRQEAAAFAAVRPLGISEQVIHFDPETGYKISVYYEGSRNADPSSESDMKRCMGLLRRLHRSGATVAHDFNIRERIGFYEKLCLDLGEIPFEDYQEVRAHMTELMDVLDRLCGTLPAQDGETGTAHTARAAGNEKDADAPGAGGETGTTHTANAAENEKDAGGGTETAHTADGTGNEKDAGGGTLRARPKVLAHVDSVADNFLFLPDGQVKLIDLEYAGMCDPLIDVAMCAIYSYYDDEQVDWLSRLYLEREPDTAERTIIYSYVALGGFLWSLWSVYKHYMGQEFGEYSIIMYRYAKRYYRKVFSKKT